MTMGSILSGCSIPKIARTEKAAQIHQAIALVGFHWPVKVNIWVHESFPRKTIMSRNMSLKMKILILGTASYIAGSLLKILIMVMRELKFLFRVSSGDIIIVSHPMYGLFSSPLAFNHNTI